MNESPYSGLVPSEYATPELKEKCAKMLERFAACYEDTFNITYGELPEVIIADKKTFEAYESDNFKRLNITPSEKELTKKVENDMCTAAFYDDNNHFILMNEKLVRQEKYLENGTFFGILAHEMVHTYQDNNGARKQIELDREINEKYPMIYINNDFEDIDVEIKRALFSFPIRVIQEGQANYMCYEMLAKHQTEFPEEFKHVSRQQQLMEEYVINMVDILNINSISGWLEKIASLKISLEAGNPSTIGDEDLVGDEHFPYFVGWQIVETAAMTGKNMDWFIKNDNISYKELIDIYNTDWWTKHP